MGGRWRLSGQAEQASACLDRVLATLESLAEELSDEGPRAGFLQSQYTMVQQVLKQAIRKITLTIEYDTGLHKESFDVIMYVTDAAGMQKVLGNLGAGQ